MSPYLQWFRKSITHLHLHSKGKLWILWTSSVLLMMIPKIKKMENCLFFGNFPSLCLYHYQFIQFHFPLNKTTRFVKQSTFTNTLPLQNCTYFWYNIYCKNWKEDSYLTWKLFSFFYSRFLLPLQNRWSAISSPQTIQEHFFLHAKHISNYFLNSHSFGQSYL